MSSQSLLRLNDGAQGFSAERPVDVGHVVAVGDNGGSSTIGRFFLELRPRGGSGLRSITWKLREFVQALGGWRFCFRPMEQRRCAIFWCFYVGLVSLEALNSWTWNLATMTSSPKCLTVCVRLQRSPESSNGEAIGAAAAAHHWPI